MLYNPIVIAVCAVIVVVPFWRITTRIGYPGWLSLAVLVPILNLGFLYGLAFATWPTFETLQLTNCPNCGREIARTTRVCPKCETRLI